ncbi:MAG: stage II sporulation protein R [Ruminococcus sp.]|nr:stage II sporulation protein R [Ruminococcus sp.]
MKININLKIFSVCLIASILISNFVVTGQRLDNLRNNVLRIHILANSDSDEDQRLKLCVRDTLLEHSEEIFGSSLSLEKAVENAEDGLAEAEKIAQAVIYENGFDYSVTAEIDNIYFNERQYGDITMPKGMYKALRIKIGEAEGHNWWCVMYPPLCIPVADKVTESEEVKEDFFSEEEIEIMEKPKKFKVRFMLWDKLKSVFDAD